jgi:hypothetical protein
MTGVLEKVIFKIYKYPFLFISFVYIEEGSLPVISPVNINYMIGEEISY